MRIQFDGPFRLVHVRCDPTVFEQPDADRPGICLWTVTTGGGCYYANHIGVSPTSMARSIADTLAAYYRGEYTIYDGNRFERREKQPVYCGGDDPMAFWRLFGCLHEHLFSMLIALHVFYAVHEAGDEELERIKATLVFRLRKEGKDIADFLDHPQPAQRDGIPMQLQVAMPPGCMLVGIREP